MKAKEYLQKLQRLDTIIHQKLKEIDNLKSMSMSVGSFDYSKDKVQISPNNDAPYVKTINKMCDLQDEINREIDQFVDERHKIINQIQGLSDSRYIDILFKHYVEYKKFETISVEIDLSYQYIIELHGHALQEFEKTYKSI